jgi:hypothetical protein
VELEAGVRAGDDQFGLAPCGAGATLTFARGLARKKVDVVNYPDGRFTVQFEGTPLPFRVFDKIQTVTPAAIVENKRLGAALAMVKEHQATVS